MSRPVSRLVIACALFGWLTASACTTHTLPATFPEPVAPTGEQVLARLLSSERPAERAVAVAVAADQKALLCWDLASGKQLWRKPVSLTTAPVLAGDQVVTQEGDAIVVRALSDGRERLSLEGEGRLVGADGIGDKVVLSVEHGSEHAPKSRILFVQGDSIRWRAELHLPAGQPALMGPYVVAPWATHRISILNADDGTERVRWFFTGTVLGHARASGKRVFVGQHGFIPISEDLLSLKTDQIQPLLPKPRQLPGHPSLLRDGYAPLPAPDNAEHRLRLHWQVGDREVPVAGDRMYLRFYRMVFGMRATEDELLWVRSFDRDLVGALQTDAGLWLADAAGTLHFVDRDGSAGAQVVLGQPLSMVALRGEPAVALHKPAQDPTLGSLTEQLTRAAALEDSRLVGARAHAVSWLARQPGAAVTETLVGLCTAPNHPELVHQTACDALAGRTDGHDHLLAALRAPVVGQRSYVGALSSAAGKLSLKRAVPSMLEHFASLRTGERDLLALVSALETLGSPKAVPVLEDFVRMHHAEPEGSPILPVVTRSIEALGGLRAQRSRRLLERLSRDGLSRPPVRKAASDALARIDAPPQPPPAAAVAAPAEPAPPPDLRPERLEAVLVERALAPVSKKLRGCLTAEGSPASARIAMVVAGDGSLEGVFVTPTTLQGCVEPLVRGQTFPATRAGRQSVTHVVQRSAPEPEKPKAGADHKRKRKRR